MRLLNRVLRRPVPAAGLQSGRGGTLGQSRFGPLVLCLGAKVRKVTETRNREPLMRLTRELLRRVRHEPRQRQRFPGPVDIASDGRPFRLHHHAGSNGPVTTASAGNPLPEICAIIGPLSAATARRRRGVWRAFFRWWNLYRKNPVSPGDRCRVGGTKQKQEV